MFIATKALRFAAMASTSAVFCSYTTAKCEEEKEYLLKQPSYLGKSSHVNVLKSEHRMTTLNDLAIITGSAHRVLAEEISHSIGVPLTEASISRFSDGEVALRIDESLHGKNVFIVQTCAAPVNDSIMELLLAVSCANRAAARRVIAVIPYFGYKHHRRGSPISTTLHSRFLSSSAMDFAKMLEMLGVDHVITVDLQRPGQGHEACFFDNMIPLETIQTRELLLDYFVQNIRLKPNVVVISPNTECVKKAKQFQQGLKTAYPDMNVRVAVFDGLEVESGPSDPNFKILLGDVTVKGADIVIVDDLVDTAGTLSVLTHKLIEMGANNVYVAASHGLFTEHAHDLIRDTPVQKVIVTNSLPLPRDASNKIVQVSVAPLLARLILMEHFRSRRDEDHYFIDEE